MSLSRIVEKWCQPNLRGCIVILICVLVEILYDCAGGVIYVYHADTWSYFGAVDIIMREGIDEFRTPVYPLLLGFFNCLTHSEHYTSIIMMIVQWMCFLTSAFYIARLLRMFNVPGKAIFWITLFYAVCPGINSHNYLIVTDSLALSFTVFYMYLCARAWAVRDVKYFVAIWVMVLIMIMLRPIFIYLLPVTVVFAALFWWGRREMSARMIIVNIAGLMVNISVIGTYVCFMNQKYDIKSISIVTATNNYHIVRSLHAKSGDDFSNKELIAAVDSCYKTTPEIAIVPFFKEWWELQGRYGSAEMAKFVNSALVNNRMGVLTKMAGHFYRATKFPIFCSAVPSTIWDLFALNISFYYIIAVLWTVAVASICIRKRKNPGIFGLCWMIYMSGLIVAIIGAPGEYGRLTLPCAAPLMVFVGWVCSHLKWCDNRPDNYKI